jgi:hypothetical protein
MYEKDVCVTPVVVSPGPTSVRLDAVGVEFDGAVSEPARLALGSDEPPMKVDDEVVSVVDSERKEHPMAPPDELGEDDGLGSLPHFDGMVTDLRRSLQEIEAGQGPTVITELVREAR